jgi:predicted phosphodiesterase
LTGLFFIGYDDNMQSNDVLHETIVMPFLSRFGLIGDVHGQFRTLDAVLRFLLGGPSLDAVLCTGDIPVNGSDISGAAAREANTCCKLLASAGVMTIRGNHDRWFVANDADTTQQGTLPEQIAASSDALLFLQSLPPTRTFQSVMGPLLLCHGVGSADMEGIYPEATDQQAADILASHNIGRKDISIVAAGHTHQHMCRNVAGISLLNPGTLLADKEPPGFAVVDLAAGIISFYEIDPNTRLITPKHRDTIR